MKTSDLALLKQLNKLYLNHPFASVPHMAKWRSGLTAARKRDLLEILEADPEMVALKQFVQGYESN